MDNGSDHLDVLLLVHHRGGDRGQLDRAVDHPGPQEHVERHQLLPLQPDANRPADGRPQLHPQLSLHEGQVGGGGGPGQR